MYTVAGGGDSTDIYPMIYDSAPYFGNFEIQEIVKLNTLQFNFSQLSVNKTQITQVYNLQLDLVPSQNYSTNSRIRIEFVKSEFSISANTCMNQQSLLYNSHPTSWYDYNDNIVYKHRIK